VYAIIAMLDPGKALTALYEMNKIRSAISDHLMALNVPHLI
jgi:hypothetical protein